MDIWTLSDTDVRIAAAASPVAAAIGVFGIVYGAAARPILGTWPTMLSSLLVFSGAAQFTMVGLLAAGAGAVSVLGAVAMLAVRHLPLGAVLRPHLRAGRTRRAVISLLLTDETTGLALTAGASPERTLVISGSLAYLSFAVGTGIGTAGGRLTVVEPLAAALFPVLFVGLAALSARARGDVVRAVLAAAATGLVLLLWPAAGALGGIAVALVVCSVVRAS